MRFMALIQKGVAAATHRMPKRISPRGHALADYTSVGLFALVATLFWKRNPRAAVAALAAGMAQAGTALITDYPGGLRSLIDFPTHGNIDMGLAAMLFTLPNILEFDDSPEAKVFRMMSLGLTAITGLTDFQTPPTPRSAPRAA
jgi:Na+/proline symporter